MDSTFGDFHRRIFRIAALHFGVVLTLLIIFLAILTTSPYMDESIADWRTWVMQSSFIALVVLMFPLVPVIGALGSLSMLWWMLLPLVLCQSFIFGCTVAIIFRIVKGEK